jgi:hypothetical protein
MADLEHFWRKTPLGPLGVNIYKLYNLYKFRKKSLYAQEEFGFP